MPARDRRDRLALGSVAYAAKRAGSVTLGSLGVFVLWGLDHDELVKVVSELEKLDRLPAPKITAKWAGPA